MNTTHAVKDLQRMLRIVADSWPQLPSVSVDGVFGEQTLEGVMVFQRDSGLPVTGVVDSATWKALSGQCARLTHTAPSSLPHYLDAPCPHEWEDEQSLLRVVRFMLNALSHIIGGFTPCEINTPAFAENLRTLQRLGDLPATGRLDNDTWKKLLRLFHLFVIRNQK